MFHGQAANLDKLYHDGQAGNRPFILDIGKIPGFDVYLFRQVFSCEMLCFPRCLNVCTESFKTRAIFDFCQISHVSMPKPFRLAEQYLIRAEAYCQKNDFSKAGNDLSTLRKMRYKSGGTINVTKDNWLQTISDERLRELYMEGFRLHDLKRWHKGFERKPQANSQAEGSSLKIEADNPLFVWPIPQHELEAPGSEILPNESNR